MEAKKIILGAFLYVFSYKKSLAKALTWPLITIFILEFIKITNPGFILTLAISVITVAVHVIIAITTHRIILLGPESISSWGITSWSLRETNFALHAIGLILITSIIGIVAFIPVITITVVGPFIFIAISCWLFGRLSLVFPGIAVDENITFEKSWKLTKNHQLIMFLVVIILPVLLAFPVFILGFSPYLSLFAFLLSMLIVVFEVAVLSMAYYVISGDSPKEKLSTDFTDS